MEADITSETKLGNRSIHISVVIPVYNEAGRIDPTLREVLKYIDTQPYEAEVLVVSDGSRDRTVEIVQALAVEHSNVVVLDNGVNRGKGFSVRRGVSESRGRFVLFSDADLATPIEEVEKLLVFLEDGYGVAIASRGLPDSDVRVRQSFGRRVMGRGFNRLVQLLVLAGIRDTQCGFKCFRREVAQQIFALQRIDGFAFDVEVLHIARKLAHRIAEVPVTWINHPVSSIRPVRDAINMFADLFRVWLNDRMGVYGETRKHPLLPS